VFARRIAARLLDGLPPRQEPTEDRRAAGLAAGAARQRIQDLMTQGAGVLRSAAGLSRAARELEAISRHPGPRADVAAWETTNLLTVGTALVAAAGWREETRGSHWREDFPERDDADWSGHLDLRLVDGAANLAYRAVDAAGAAS
jgi:L-aspartate oxidase